MTHFNPVQFLGGAATVAGWLCKTDKGVTAWLGFTPSDPFSAVSYQGWFKISTVSALTLSSF